MSIQRTCNNEVRQRMKDAGVPQWLVAEALGKNEFSFSRELRHELPDEEKQRILDAIDRIAEKGGQA